MPPPDRWDEYQALGSVIPGTKFIAFKVPLKEALCHNLPEEESFSPERLVESVKASGKTLGLVVDLTFTRKYYNGEMSFGQNDIQYEKIFTKGHEVPSDEVFQRFWDVVEDFTARNTDEDLVIGVHCTHGINRTGYLVCRYMIEKLNIDPEKAISLFGEARGHHIERENYLNDLKSRPKDSSGSSPHGNEKIRSPQSDSWRHGNGHHVHSQSSERRKHPYNSHRWDKGHRHDHSPGFQGQRWGEGHRDRGAHLVDLYQRPLPGSSFQGHGRGRHYSSHSSPLDRCEEQAPSGWGSAARSGWGVADQQRDWGHRNQRYNDRWGGVNSAASGGYGHYHRNKSWQRDQAHHDSHSYRDREQHASSNDSGRHREGRGFSDSGGGGRHSGGDSRADRDTNWRQKGVGEGRGAQVGGFGWGKGVQGRVHGDYSNS